jgi:hypothetical protein
LSRSAKRIFIVAVALVAVLSVVFVALRGCTLMPWGNSGKGGASLSVSITRDFGKVIIKSKSVKARSGDSVMDVLKRAADVKTEYGGGFVSSIEGLRSSPGTGGGNDWFYFVNGVLAGIGAAEYEVEAGDHVWWDYHAWNRDNFIPAVVGSYPRPFTRGYSREDTTTRILYGANLENTARKIGAFLERHGAAVEYRGDLEEQSGTEAKGPVIAVCTTVEAAGKDWIRRLLDGSGRSGTFLTLDGEKIISLDSGGKTSDTGEELVAAVAATGSGIGDPFPRWLVICAGEDGASQAARLMVSEPEALKLKVGAAVGSSGAVYPLPR